MTAQNDQGSVSTVEVSGQRADIGTGAAAGELMHDAGGAKSSSNNRAGTGNGEVEGKGEGKGNDLDKIEVI